MFGGRRWVGLGRRGREWAGFDSKNGVWICVLHLRLRGGPRFSPSSAPTGRPANFALCRPLARSPQLQSGLTKARREGGEVEEFREPEPAAGVARTACPVNLLGLCGVSTTPEGKSRDVRRV